MCICAYICTYFSLVYLFDIFNPFCLFVPDIYVFAYLSLRCIYSFDILIYFRQGHEISVPYLYSMVRKVSKFLKVYNLQ